MGREASTQVADVDGRSGLSDEVEEGGENLCCFRLFPISNVIYFRRINNNLNKINTQI